MTQVLKWAGYLVAGALVLIVLVVIGAAAVALWYVILAAIVGVFVVGMAYAFFNAWRHDRRSRAR